MKKIAILLSAFLAAACAVEEDLERTAGGNQDLVYPPVVNADGEINPELFNVINLDYPGLERVKEYYEAGDYEYAAYYLLEYYRNRSSVSNPGVDAVIMNPSATASEINMADQALAANGYRFYVRNYSESTDETTGLDTYYSFAAEDGTIDWETVPDAIGGPSDPPQEWASQKHRHQWMLPQAKAYLATGNEDYVISWKEVYSDWLATYPCPQSAVTSSDLPWYGLQPAERVIDQTSIMMYYLRSENFTPSWLSTFLTAFVETVECVRANPYTDPAGNVAHNITMTQQKAIFMAAVLFPELKNASTWMTESAAAIGNMISGQFNSDGVLNELDPSYHIGTVANYYDVMKLADANSLSSLLPADFVNNLRGACSFVMDIIYPDYTLDNFNDTRSVSWSRSVLTRNLRNYLEMFPDDDNLRWMASEGRSGSMPTDHVQTYPVSGYYMLRTGWTSDAMMLVLKNNYNPNDQWHCQPDNNSFTIWRNGRRFSPDAGCYTYDSGSTRDIYRAADMHNTMTKLGNGSIDNTLGEFLLQDSGQNYEVVVTENPAYADLTHRRAVFLVDNTFFVIVDEGYGSYAGGVSLHFKGGNDGSGRAMYVLDNVPSAASTAEDVPSGESVGMHTTYDDGNNILFATFPETETGYQSWWNTGYFSDAINERTQRNVYRVDMTKAGDGAARLVTVIYPYGAASEFDSIDVSARFTDNSSSEPGTFHESGASVEVTVNGTAYNLSYTLN